MLIVVSIRSYGDRRAGSPTWVAWSVCVLELTQLSPRNARPRGRSHYTMAVHTIHKSALTRSPHLEGLASSRRPCGATRGQEGDARVGPPPHTSHSPAQLARLAGLSAPPVLNTAIASRRASPSYPLLVLQIESVANHHVVLDEFAYNRADGHLIRDEEQLLVREVHTAL